MSDSPEVSQRSGARQSGTEWLKQLEQGDRPFASAVERMVRDLRDVARAAEEEAVGQLLAATARLDGENTQAGVLSALLEEGRRFASRTAFFLTRPGEVRGWAGCGFSGRTSPPVTSSLEQVQLTYDDESFWAKLAQKSGVVTLSAEDCSAVCRGLGAPAGSHGVLIPLILRGELGGALYADRSNGEEPLGVASLQILTHSAAQTIETAPVRGAESSATLRHSAAAAVAAPAEAAVEAAKDVTAAADDLPAAVEEDVVEEDELRAEEAEPRVEDVVEEDEVEEAERLEDVDFEMVSAAETEADEAPREERVRAEQRQAVDDIPAELEPEPELEDTSEIWMVEEEDEEPTVVGPDPAAPALPEPGQETVRLDVGAFQGQVPAAPPPPSPPAAPAAEEETTELPQWEVEAAPAAPELEPEDVEPRTEPVATRDFSEDATFVAPRDRLVPPRVDHVPPAPSTEVTPPADFTSRFGPPVEASTEVRPAADFRPPVAPPPAKPDSTGTTQVVPPTDIQGPGSAFAKSRRGIPEGEEALHEEARRLARLLVSEIKLYNEEIIEEGRRAGNIYERLKDDIDRSRQMYEERIDPRLLESDADYFHQELVQRLAGGDSRLLGY